MLKKKIVIFYEINKKERSQIFFTIAFPVKIMASK